MQGFASSRNTLKRSNSDLVMMMMMLMLKVVDWQILKLISKVSKTNLLEQTDMKKKIFVFLFFFMVKFVFLTYFFFTFKCFFPFDLKRSEQWEAQWKEAKKIPSKWNVHLKLILFAGGIEHIRFSSWRYLLCDNGNINHKEHFEYRNFTFDIKQKATHENIFMLILK